MNDQLKLRKAKKIDLNQISKIFMTEFNKEPYYEKWTYKSAVKKINEYFKKSIIFIIEQNNKLIGFIIISLKLWSDGKRGHINEIVISNEYQGRGYGKLLINKAESYFKYMGIKIITLESLNISKAFNIYKKMGFKEDGIVSMEKELK